MSTYNIEVVKKIIIFNPAKRGPLTIGEIIVDSNYAEKALQNAGGTLHRLEPFEVLDKVGFLKTGDEAAEMFLDALADQVDADIQGGGQFVHIGGGGMVTDSGAQTGP
jgi:hypothetical protein